MFAAIRSYFHKENSVKGASLILIVTLALSNVLGVFRDHFLAQKIPTDRLDIYFASFRLPDLVFNILILGSVAAAYTVEKFGTQTHHFTLAQFKKRYKLNFNHELRY